MKFRFLLLILTALAVFAGCAHIESEQLASSEPVYTDPPPVKQDYPVSFENEVFDSSPQTVASLSPALTDILFDLGLSERLVGVSDYCRAPSEDITKIGSPAMPDIDAIISLAPQLLISQSPLASADVIRLKQAGIRTLYIPVPSSFEYLCEEYIRLSLVFYGAVDSKDIAVSALSEIDGAMVAASQSGLNTDFVIITAARDSGYAVAGEEALVSDMLGVFGENIFGGEQTAVLSKDELLGMNPQTVIADDSLDEDDIKELFDNSPRVIITDLTAFERPTAALSEAIENIMGSLR